MPLTKVTKSLITSVDVSQINTTGSDAGKVLTSDGSTLNWVASSSIGSTGITRSTAVTLTSQTSVDFTGIPSTAKRITVMLNSVSTNVATNLLLQVGTSTGVITTGYNSVAQSNTVTTFSNTYMQLTYSNAIAYLNTGATTLLNISGNSWVYSSLVSPGVASVALSHGAGSITCGSTLDRVRITTVTGTALFDAGTINIMWE